ncbi:GIY-YIG nuclease family protein [Halomonas huangheensis]|uniref:GIY-YIG nuclease family protein n=1 Tax=Halomonas huangheensis TaxID=1178482 RepID=UPI0012DC71B4|nr:GIY-YIG nuclease family protein [Halomonas huangheensis]
MPLWYVYVVETAAGALYTGISTDVVRRLEEHRSGRGAKALRGRGPLTLVHQVPVGDRSEALREEARIKRLSVAAKRRWLTQCGAVLGRSSSEARSESGGATPG